MGEQVRSQDHTLPGKAAEKTWDPSEWNWVEHWGQQHLWHHTTSRWALPADNKMSVEIRAHGAGELSEEACLPRSGPSTTKSTWCIWVSCSWPCPKATNTSILGYRYPSRVLSHRVICLHLYPMTSDSPRQDNECYTWLCLPSFGNDTNTNRLRIQSWRWEWNCGGRTGWARNKLPRELVLEPWLLPTTKLTFF